jgi:hypothetical protein
LCAFRRRKPLAASSMPAAVQRSAMTTFRHRFTLWQIEHLPDQTLPFHFAEMFRCLRNGGVIRVGEPNADSAIRKFQENDAAWFSDFPDKRRSIGGKFANFILCRGEHLTILTSSYMTEIASDAGFQDIKFCKPVTQTNFPAVFDQRVISKESESTPEVPHTLLMEARRPES